VPKRTKRTKRHPHITEYLQMSEMTSRQIQHCFLGRRRGGVQLLIADAISRAKQKGRRGHSLQA
jgi:hypothetical protein